MIQMQTRFLALWQECYDAAYYVLRTKKAAGFLHDAAALEKEIHRQVWDERFGNALIAHPASVFLDDLQAESIETAIQVRSRMRGFRPKIGMNLPRFRGLLALEALLLLLLIVLPRLFLFRKIKWLLIIGLGALLLLGAAAAVRMLTQSLQTPQALKKAFEDEKNTILTLLDTAR